MERATKLLVVVWTCVALAADAWLLRHPWPALPLLTAGALAGAAVATAIDRRAVGIVLIFTYVFPALIAITHGTFHVDFTVIWLAALLGAMLPDAVRTGWHLPVRWRGPLVCWALVIAVATPIVVFREMDFYPALLAEPRLANALSGGGGPVFVIRWVLLVAVSLVLGILWFDWLCGARHFDFARAVVFPLGASALAMSAVSTYQLLGDFTFLNQNVFGGLGRASGTVFDANVAGAVAALWAGGFLWWGRGFGRWRFLLVVVGVSTAWLAVWASGSRTAFACATGVTIFAAVGGLRAGWWGRPRFSLGSIAAGVAILAGALVVMANANSEVVGPLQRLWSTIPENSASGWRDFARELWNRNGYGEAATAMIREFPFFGVGVGSFHMMGPEYVPRELNLIPDNAQNWYRHQLVEFGIVGSLAWLAWVVSFGWFVLTAPVPAEGWTLRGMVVTFAAVSLVGMPSQSPLVTVTFWTSAYWFLQLAAGTAATPPLSTRTWLTIGLIVAVFCAGTARQAVTNLRVPVRAQTRGWHYAYGLYPPEADGAGGEMRWAKRRSAIVVEASAPQLEVTLRVNHLDVHENPVRVGLRVNQSTVLQEELDSVDPVTYRTRVREGERLLLETVVSRTINPRDHGVADDRELGVLITWRFLQEPPG